MIVHIPSLRIQLAMYAFALSLSTAAIKTFSLLSGLAIPASIYVMGGILSVVVFSVFATLMLSMVLAPATKRA